MLDSLINFLDFLGIVAFALSGAFLAAKHNMDPIGYMLLGLVTAIGGGTIRDVILNRDVFWVIDVRYLYVSIFISLIGGIFASRSKIEKLKTFQSVVLWSDAIGLCTFATLGTQIAYQMQMPYAVCILAAVLTATGGGIVRDVLAGVKPFITYSEVYAFAAIMGGACYLIIISLTDIPTLAAIGSLLIGFLLRAGGIIKNWHVPFTNKNIA